MKWNNLGAQYHLLGQYREAAEHYRKALEVWGQSSPGARANTLMNLATLERQRGRYPESESYLRQARQIENSPRVDIAAAHLAREQGQPARARAMAEQVLSRPNLSPADRASAAEAIAQTYRDQGRLDLAAQYWRRAAETWVDEPGSERRLATALNNLAELSSAQRQFDDAERYARQSLDLSEKILGPHHRRTAIARNNLAQAMRLRGVTAGVEELYLKAIADLRALGEEAVADIGRFLANLADFYHSLGRETKAVFCYREAIDHLRSARGVTVSEIAAQVACLAEVRASQGRFVESLHLFGESIPQLESAWGTSDQRVRKLQARLAQVKRLADHYRVAVD